MTTIRTTLVIERVVEVEIEGLHVPEGPDSGPFLDRNSLVVREIAVRTAIASGQAAPGDTIRLIRAVPAQKEITP